MENDPKVLRKIVALCGPSDIGVVDVNTTMCDNTLLHHADHIIAHAPRVLRERGVDVRWVGYGWVYYPVTGGPSHVGKVENTEAEAILVALEATAPKQENPKERYAVRHGNSDRYVVDLERGQMISMDRVVALLNATPGYTQADKENHNGK